MFLQINFECLENYLSIIEGTVWGQWHWVGLNTGVGQKISLGLYGIYRYAPHNDISVNDGPHIRRCSH